MFPFACPRPRSVEVSLRASLPAYPRTLHCTSCTLRLTPYALRPTPYVLPAPYALHPAPHTLCPALHPAPCTLRPTPYILHPTPYTLYSTHYTQHPATQHPTTYTCCLTRRTKPSTPHHTPCTHFIQHHTPRRPPTPRSHPTSCTLHPTPTLNPLHSTPYTQLTTPNILHSTLNPLHPTPYAPQASNAKIAADLGITALLPRKCTLFRTSGERGTSVPRLEPHLALRGAHTYFVAKPNTLRPAGLQRQDRGGPRDHGAVSAPRQPGYSHGSGPISPDSGRDCVKSLQSSDRGLYPQSYDPPRRRPCALTARL